MKSIIQFTLTQAMNQAIWKQINQLIKNKSNSVIIIVAHNDDKVVNNNLVMTSLVTKSSRLHTHKSTHEHTYIHAYLCNRAKGHLCNSLWS